MLTKFQFSKWSWNAKFYKFYFLINNPDHDVAAEPSKKELIDLTWLIFKPIPKCSSHADMLPWNDIPNLKLSKPKIKMMVSYDKDDDEDDDD